MTIPYHSLWLQPIFHKFPSEMFILTYNLNILITQNTVANLLSHNHLQDGKRIARSEVERRTRFFEELEAAPGNTQCNHQLKDLVVECLDNDYRRRPSSEHVMNRLELLKKSNKVDIPNSGDITRAASILKEAERNRIKKVSV